jgi:uncharacterized protein (TIGR02646 family)
MGELKRMIYIKKEGVPGEITRKVIEIRKSDKWKAIEEYDTKSIREVFDNDFPKNEVKEILIREQRGLCAYCMRRIRMDSHSRVEHWMPLSKDKDKSLDYNNMLGVCDGGEKLTGQKGHIVCCDAHKGEAEISISPLNRAQMDKIAYTQEGIIYTNPRDESMEKDINETLLLNGIRKKNDSVRDTSTEVLKGRRDAYDRARRMMVTLNNHGKCTSVSVKKKIDELYEKDERDEYVGVILYYLNKKYKSLIKRGM